MNERFLTDISRSLLEKASAAGAEAADVLAVDDQSLLVEVRDGALEQAERSEGVEVGLRVFVGCRQATVAARDIRPETLAVVAERAVDMAREAPDDRYAGLAEESDLSEVRDAESLELADTGPDPTPESLKDAACRAEAAALAVRGISRMDGTGAEFSRRRVVLVTSTGFVGAYTRTGRSVSCIAITGEGAGMERDYAHEGRVWAEDMPEPEEVGRLAAERTLARAGAGKAPTGAYPVVYDERVSGGLIGHLLSAANGAAVARGASWLMDAMGESVLPEGFSLIEDPHRPRIGLSRPFDAEGLRTKTAPIVENGVLRRWILDLSSARRLGLVSTANAVRGAGGSPSPSVSNIKLSGPMRSRASLLSDMGTGLLVTSLMGASINPNTGDYSRGAAGFWVENGEIAHPVNECTLAGNLRDMLRSIRAANDARQHMSHVVPSLLVEGLTIAGV